MGTRLYMVSLGPGDAELVSIKALKALKKSEAICIPTKSSDGSFERSITYKIVDDLFCEFEFKKPTIPIYSPMKFQMEHWQNQVDTITKALEDFDVVSYVTLGDAAIYSTIYYLLELIKEQNRALFEDSEVIPGITSFSLASAKVKKPLCLGDLGLEIVPLLGKEVAKTKVYMRPKVGLQTDVIKEEGDIYTFSDLAQKDECIESKKIQNVEKYMTLFIDFKKAK